MADRVLPSRYMQVERNDDHPLAWFTPDGKGWVPVDGADPSAIDYEAATELARTFRNLEWNARAVKSVVDAALPDLDF